MKKLIIISVLILGVQMAFAYTNANINKIVWHNLTVSQKINNYKNLAVIKLIYGRDPHAGYRDNFDYFDDYATGKNGKNTTNLSQYPYDNNFICGYNNSDDYSTTFSLSIVAFTINGSDDCDDYTTIGKYPAYISKIYDNDYYGEYSTVGSAFEPCEQIYGNDYWGNYSTGMNGKDTTNLISNADAFKKSGFQWYEDYFDQYGEYNSSGLKGKQTTNLSVSPIFSNDLIIDNPWGDYSTINTLSPIDMTDNEEWVDYSTDSLAAYDRYDLFGNNDCDDYSTGKNGKKTTNLTLTPGDKNYDKYYGDNSTDMKGKDTTNLTYTKFGDQIWIWKDGYGEYSTGTQMSAEEKNAIAERKIKEFLLTTPGDTEKDNKVSLFQKAKEIYKEKITTFMAVPK